MIKAAIFDFNRTLYLPELCRVPEEVVSLLLLIKARGILLGLLSKKAENREEQIKQVSKFFSEIKLVNKKSENDFIEMLRKLGIKTEEAVVIGDRLRAEIRLANRLGIKTIWFRNGKFKDELPEAEDKPPDFIITSLKEFPQILNTLNKGE